LPPNNQKQPLEGHGTHTYGQVQELPKLVHRFDFQERAGMIIILITVTWINREIKKT